MRVITVIIAIYMEAYISFFLNRNGGPQNCHPCKKQHRSRDNNIGLLRTTNRLIGCHSFFVRGILLGMCCSVSRITVLSLPMAPVFDTVWDILPINPG